jgi:hypothetical protein
MKVANKITFLVIGFSLLLAACSSPSGEESPTPQPEAVMTAAAQTAEAQLTELAEPVSTTTAAPPAEGTPPAITLTSDAGLDDPASPAATSAATSTAATGGVDLAEFWADITVSDGTQYDPEEEFTKIWQLRNAGTNTWTQEYGLAFFGGAQMSGPAEVFLTGNVSPGDTVDIPVNLAAPQAGGTHIGYWKMQDPAGEFFDYAVFVEIIVVGGTTSGTSPPKPSGSGRVTAASIKVDDSSPSDCPHTFTFTTSFTLDEPATVTYRLEAGSDTPGFVFDLPGELTGSFDTGTHSVVYYLNIQNKVNGWAQFHILAPNDLVSKATNFSLSCDS